MNTLLAPVYNNKALLFTMLLIAFVTSVDMFGSELGSIIGTITHHSNWPALNTVLLALLLFNQHRLGRTLRELPDLPAPQDAEINEFKRGIRYSLDQQFDLWDLTTTERDVALGLLKGLTCKEIARCRDTQEKTVRQQASNIYRKAGLASRNELAAWFFEDAMGVQ